jgi:hypothetical protein
MNAIISKKTSNKRLGTATSKTLNISRTTLTRRISIREQLETINPNLNLAIVCWGPRNDKVSNEWRNMIVEFWNENSIVSSNRRDVLTQRLSRGVREEHQKHLLDNSQTDLFHKFQDAHHDIVIGKQNFEAIKPWYIHPNKVCETCCCRYHVEFNYYYELFRNYRLQFQSAICQVCLKTT